MRKLILEVDHQTRKAEGLVFEDLRAIPFVGSWSQLKQNVPGFFGVGTALKHYEDAGEFEKAQKYFRRPVSLKH